MTHITEFFGPAISTYTRAQALEDGALIDATTLAAEAGFTVPLALTAAAHGDAVAWDEDNRALQDVTGRLWDVLVMAHTAIWRVNRDHLETDRVTFSVLRIPNTHTAQHPTLTNLVVAIGPGDDAEPVATIMTPTED